MNIKGLTIGFALTGSFCTINESIPIITQLVDMEATVIPIISNSVSSYCTRFTNNIALKKQLTDITGNKPFETIVDSEPIGPRGLLDLVVVYPCTGNTIAKIANGITDTSVTMAVKAHLRNEKPCVIGISTNDGLGANAKNIGHLLNMKHMYFVPFYQDDPIRKSRSLVAKSELVIETISQALDGKQIQPLL